MVGWKDAKKIKLNAQKSDYSNPVEREGRLCRKRMCTPPFAGHVAAMCCQYVHYMSATSGGHVPMRWPLGSIANGDIVWPHSPGNQLPLKLAQGC
jgi:hypothetical protein